VLRFLPRFSFLCPHLARYLTEDHNEAFRAFREDRATKTMPPPSHPGAVAVECYGRQAERGGGWVSFAPGGAGAAATVVDLKPNTTGIWCTELALTAGGGKSGGGGGGARMALVAHEQFNLYKDLAGETSRFAKYVCGLAAGAVVVVSIADTACAKSRPLGPKVR